MNKDQVIDALLERSNHGTRREDVVAAYEAGEAADRERLMPLRDTLETIAAQSSGVPGSTARADCMAALARLALRNDDDAIRAQKEPI